MIVRIYSEQIGYVALLTTEVPEPMPIRAKQEILRDTCRWKDLRVTSRLSW